MTDQPPPPPPAFPDEGAPSRRRRARGASLIERAAGTYGFAVAPQPEQQPHSAPAPEPRFEPAAPAPSFEAFQAPPSQAPTFESGPVPATFTPAVTSPVPEAPSSAMPAPFTGAAPPAIEGIPAAQIFRGRFHPIDRQHLRDQCLIEPEGPVTALLEEFRIIKRQLLLTAAESRAGRAAQHGERILVASAHSGEGKTFCAVNLALSIAAEKDNEVLLIDADFAKPSVLSTLGLPGGPGLLDALADPRVAVQDCILGTDIPGLFVLPAGNTTGSDTEYLASARTAQVLARLTAHAPNRIVIFDSPPVLAASPASELAFHVGQAVVVVRADHTGEAALRDTLGLLGGCPDLKLLLNCTRFSPTGRRFGTYYGYRE